MSNKTIAKYCAFVICFTPALLIFSACSIKRSDTSTSGSQRYSPPVITGNLSNPEITESSGLAASKCQPNVYWTHNDSGDDAFIYAINRSGGRLGTWRVIGASNVDWEDIALFKDSQGNCTIYIAEIGDNSNKRSEHIIYRLSEPTVTPADADSSRQQPRETGRAQEVRFSYPDSNPNAETLLVEPKTANIYVVTKRLTGPAGVYRIRSEYGTDQVVKAEKIADISLPAIPNGLVTGGAVSPDGRSVVICDYSRAYELTLPDNSKNFDDIWEQQPETIDVGKRKIGEAVTYTPDGLSLILTSEGDETPVIEVKRKPVQQDRQ